MANSTGEPLQIPADACNLITARTGQSDDRNHNVTLTLPKKTANGATGQVVFKNGKISSYTAPT